MSIDEQLAALSAMDRQSLCREFHRAYLRAPPLRLSDKILRLAVGYRWQEEVYGGLKTEIRKQLLSAQPMRALSKAVAGTVLIREWQGREHTVVVRPDHVDYAGARYRSLTEVALKITGQKRSGPAFFGLRK